MPAVIKLFLRILLNELLAQGLLPDYIQSTSTFHEILPFIPDWCSFVMGTEDMTQAYRQVPIDPEHACVCIVAFWHEAAQDVRFTMLHGHPYGLSSAVLNFNRTPALFTAVARRCACVLCDNFFDDTGIVDCPAACGSGQAFVRHAYSLAGALLDDSKSQPMCVQRVFLGVLADLGQVTETGVVVVDLKPGLRDALLCDIDALFDSQCCTPAQASKLRGRLGWAATAMYGKCGRGGQSALIDRQYYDTEIALSPPLAHSLLYLKEMVALVPPRQICVLGRPQAAIRLYSDASFEPADSSPARLGYVIFHDDDLPPVAGTATLPQDVLACFVQRQQQITVCEAFCGILVPFNHHELFQGRDIIWFIDNQAAVSALIKGTSSHHDISLVAALTHLMFALLGARVYFEWVDSEANPSDGLSRLGLLDPWTLCQGWSLLEAPLPPWQVLSGATFSEAIRVFEDHWENKGVGRLLISTRCLSLCANG